MKLLEFMVMFRLPKNMAMLPVLSNLVTSNSLPLVALSGQDYFLELDELSAREAHFLYF